MNAPTTAQSDATKISRLQSRSDGARRDVFAGLVVGDGLRSPIRDLRKAVNAATDTLTTTTLATIDSQDKFQLDYLLSSTLIDSRLITLAGAFNKLNNPSVRERKGHRKDFEDMCKQGPEKLWESAKSILRGDEKFSLPKLLLTVIALRATFPSEQTRWSVTKSEVQEWGMESFRRSFPDCVDAKTTGASTGSSQPVTLDLDRVRRMSNTYHNLEALRIFVVFALYECIDVNWNA